MGGAAGFQQHIARQRLLPALQPFLQAGLGVLLELPGFEFVEHRRIEAGNRTARGVETGIEVNRSEDRFQRIGEDRGACRAAAFQLAFAQAQDFADFQLLRQSVQAFLAHQIGTQARQVAFGQGRETVIEDSGDDAIQDAITKEFQPFVIGRAETAMGQRRPQQRRIGKAMADPLGKDLQGHAYLAVVPLYSISRLALPNKGIFLS